MILAPRGGSGPPCSLVSAALIHCSGQAGPQLFSLSSRHAYLFILLYLGICRCATGGGGQLKESVTHNVINIVSDRSRSRLNCLNFRTRSQSQRRRVLEGGRNQTRAPNIVRYDISNEKERGRRENLRGSIPGCRVHSSSPWTV